METSMQENLSLSLTEQKKIRQQKILDKQKARMAMVTNTTEENVEMPEEFDRFEKQQEQIKNPNQLGDQLNQIPGLNQFMKPLAVQYSKKRDMLFLILQITLSFFTFFFSLDNCSGFLGPIQQLILSKLYIEVEYPFTMFMLQQMCIIYADFKHYKINSQVQNFMHCGKQFFVHIFSYYVLKLVFKFSCSE